MKNIIIRRATKEDFNDILKLNRDLFEKEYNEFDKTLELNWTLGQEGRGYFARRIVGLDGFVVVAESEGKIIGYLCGGLCDRASYRIEAKYAELENMIVKDEFRGKGIGFKMADEFMKWCKNKKVNYISVKASARNNGGINFYHKLGFEDYDLVLEKKVN